MNKSCATAKIFGIAMLSFGVGILVSFFLPDPILVVIEAVVIIGAGFLYFSKK
jgi:hypothetical protein